MSPGRGCPEVELHASDNPHLLYVVSPGFVSPYCRTESFTQGYLTGVDIGILPPPPPARSILSTQQLVAGLKIEKLQLTAELR
jgi:hypothetical protein